MNDVNGRPEDLLVGAVVELSDDEGDAEHVCFGAHRLPRMGLGRAEARRHVPIQRRACNTEVASAVEVHDFDACRVLGSKTKLLQFEVTMRHAGLVQHGDGDEHILGYAQNVVFFVFFHWFRPLGEIFSQNLNRT